MEALGDTVHKSTNLSSPNELPSHIHVATPTGFPRNGWLASIGSLAEEEP